MAHPISSMAATHSPSLSDLAAAKGIRFGSAVAGQGGGSWRNPALADLLKRECSILVAENEMKWQAIRPSPTAFDFAAFDDIARFAGQTKMALRGHTLLWHRSKWMPRWLEKHDFGPQPATAAARLMANHVETVCARYNGKITSFDVVNETVLPEDGILAQTALSKAMGSTEALVDLAFHTARMAAPGVELVYNDYMSWEPGNALHRMGVLRLLEGFRKRGTPVDALGIQSHLIAPVPDAAYQREWRRFVDEVVAMDYRLVITEFDVRDRDLPVDIPSRDRTVADTAKAYFETMLDYPQLRDVLAWGMVDAYSWLQGYEPRADKAEARGCLYDSHFRPKPVYAALAQAFVEARPRT
ncbi:endo-1,4-beta-xylanase [Novosphingobium taihuense]|uniref:Beta-xylanase n=1 Tax=Novosphingobium taihuense TaxID=260085 RepID=A0A7W7EVC0_9SPHN|nr:endo-1,4-beta-xylanase [Novosphingobium taihuense]